MSWKVASSNPSQKVLPPPPPFKVTSPGPNDLKPASNGGHGTDDALRVTQILEKFGIPCCLVGISALIFYGAGRVRPVSLTLFLSLPYRGLLNLSSGAIAC